MSINKSVNGGAAGSGVEVMEILYLSEVLLLIEDEGALIT